MSVSKTARHPADLETSSRLFGLLCAFDFAIQFIFRWGGYRFFRNYGAYGWSRPGAAAMAGMMLAVLASALVVFYFSAVLVSQIAARWSPLRGGRLSAQTAIVGLSLAAIVYMELDSSWYALSMEHIRWSDVQIALQPHFADHFGISYRDTAKRFLLLSAHAVFLVVVWRALCRFFGEYVAAHPRLTRRAEIVLFALTTAGFCASFQLVRHNNVQWASIARSDPYDVTPSRFVGYGHPDRAALNAMLAEAINRQNAPAGGATPVAPLQDPIAPGVKHVLVIAIEGWSAGYADPEIMPFFSKLRQSGIYFSNHYSSGNNTLLGLLGLAYGQSPLFFFQDEADSETGSPYIKRLNESGFATKRFGSGLATYRNIGSYLRDFSADSGDEPGFDQTMRDILSHIKQHKKTFTLFYYLDTHFPYRHSEAFTKYLPETPVDLDLSYGVSPDMVPAVRNRYKNALSEADHRLETLFAGLDWRDMLIIVTGDHGEGMMEKGRLSHSSSVEKEMVETPMFLYYPGIRRDVRTFVSSHLDIMPTILDVLGIEGKGLGGQGVSLVRRYTDRHALVANNNQNSRPTQFAVVSDGSKLMLDASALRHIRVADLLSTDDSVKRLSEEDRPALSQALSWTTAVFRSSGCRQRTGEAGDSEPDKPGALRFCH